MRQEFYYPSRDGHTQIHAIEWIPEGDIQGILQISHGMVEYIARYHDFAEYLSKRGYYVVGQDHLGHGGSAADGHYGFFHETDGNACVIGDMQKLYAITRHKYPEIPYFMLGHSMGSFLVRQYIQMYGKNLAGAIIMGTGYQPALLLRFGMLLCRGIAARKGWHYPSKMIERMAKGNYNHSFRAAKTNVDWISRDEEMVAAYVKDPWCTFPFTVNGYYHMFGGMVTLTDQRRREKIPKDLPLLLVSGKNDPVGGFGKGVRRVYKEYLDIGLTDVKMKLYKENRHEILNDLDRLKVYRDLYEWLEEKKGGQN